MKTILFILLSLILVSCEESIKYPRYTLYEVEYIPDSMKAEYRTWITETIRAASQHMTGGDYEHVNRTIKAAEYTANRIFSETIIGLKKEVDADYYHDIYLTPNKMNPYERHVYDSLMLLRP